MSADTVIRYGADTGDVRKAQQDLVRSSRQTGREVGRINRNIDETFRTFVSAEAAKQAVFGSIRLASDAARNSERLADNYVKITSAVGELKQQLGEDIATALFSDADASVGAIELIGAAADRASSKIANYISLAEGAAKGFRDALGDSELSVGPLTLNEGGGGIDVRRGLQTFRDTVNDRAGAEAAEDADDASIRRGLVQRSIQIADRQREARRLGLQGRDFDARRAGLDAQRLAEQRALNRLDTFVQGSGLDLQFDRDARQREIADGYDLGLEVLDRELERYGQRVKLKRELDRALATPDEADDVAARRAGVVFSARTNAEDESRRLGRSDELISRDASEAARLAGATFDRTERERHEGEADRRARERRRFEDRVDSERARRLRATGETREADALEGEISLRQAIADINQSDALTAQEKLDIERRLREEVEGRLSAEQAIGRERQSFRTLSPGSGELAGVVFGAGGGGVAERSGTHIARDRRRRVRQGIEGSLAMRRFEQERLLGGGPDRAIARESAPAVVAEPPVVAPAAAESLRLLRLLGAESTAGGSGGGGVSQQQFQELINEVREFRTETRAGIAVDLDS